MTELPCFGLAPDMGHGSFRNPGTSVYYRGLIIRIGFWGILYHKYIKEPPKIVLVSIKAPIL